MEETLQTFEKAWQHFETSFKGKLRSKSKEQKITLSLANLILKEVSGDWFSGYGVEGKWLRDYKNESPEKAEAVTKYLKYELKLGTDTTERQENKADRGDQGVQSESSNTKYVIPAVGAVAGAVIASAFSAPGIVILAAAAVPGVWLYSKAKTKDTGKPAASKNMQTGIDNYIALLQVHRKKITGIIRV